MDISKDGVNWTNVWSPTLVSDGAASPVGGNMGWKMSSSAPWGYIVFPTTTPTNPTMTAQYIRLTWGANTNSVNLEQWEIFGY